MREFTQEQESVMLVSKCEAVMKKLYEAGAMSMHDRQENFDMLWEYHKEGKINQVRLMNTLLQRFHNSIVGSQE